MSGGAKGRNISFLMGEGGGGGVYAAPAANNFLSLRLPANTFLLAYMHYFSFYSLCKQFISSFSNALPSQKNNGSSLI